MADDANKDIGEEASPMNPLAADISFARTLTQFFVIPALVVAICVGIFFFFAWIVSDEKTGKDYLTDIKTGSASRRWQAAFELSKMLTMDANDPELKALAPQMVALFQQAGEDDPRVRHYLALSLGHLKTTAAVPALVSALGSGDATTRIYSAWALGNIGAGSAVDPVAALVGDSDPGVRKMAVYSLGALGNPKAVPTLLPALSDPQLDVSWNAAIALAQLGDDSGLSKILQMLDRTYLGGIADMNEAQRLLAMESAIHGAALLGGSELEEKLQEIAGTDANLGLRRAALQALQSLQGKNAELR